MKNYLQHLMLCLALLFAAAGCKKDDAVGKSKLASALVQSSIAGVNGPTIGKVNQELIFSVVWQNTDVTTKFDHLQDSTSHNTKVIRLFALTNIADSTAVANKDIATIPYKFKAATAGTYYLKFYQADNSDKTVIIDTLNIK